MQTGSVLAERAGLLPASVSVICPGVLHAVGGWLPADLRVSWLPARQGWLPVQCYVLQSGDQRLLIDAGLAAHRAEVRAGLEALFAGSRQRAMMMTRREPDAIINLPWIMRDFDLAAVRAGGPSNPLEFFEKVEEISSDAQIRAMSGVAMERAPPGSTFACGDLSIEVLRTNLRVLATNWLYETTTGTLFCSDSWGFVTRPKQGDRIAAAPDDDTISTERVLAYLGVKFDWLVGTNPATLIEELRRMFAERSINRLCPSFGCVIEGREAVERLLENTFEAMRVLSTRRRASALAGMPWHDIAARVGPGVLHLAGEVE